MMLVKIRQKWNLSEKKKQPVFDHMGKHVIMTDPITGEARPMYEMVDYEIGDSLDITDPTSLLKAGLCIRLDSEGNEITTTQSFKTEEGSETRSGRVFYNKYVEKYDKDPVKVKEALELEEKLLLDKIAQYGLLKTASKVDGSLRRQYFLDHESQQFLSGFWETIRVEIASLIDDRIADLERRIPRNVE